MSRGDKVLCWGVFVTLGIFLVIALAAIVDTF